MTEWEIIPDEKVRALWRCPECDEQVYIEPHWYTENGIPLCNCGMDMVYIHTEINT